MEANLVWCLSIVVVVEVSGVKIEKRDFGGLFFYWPALEDWCWWWKSGPIQRSTTGLQSQNQVIGKFARADDDSCQY